MSPTIKPEHLPAWQAIVVKANAARPEGAPEITLAEYAQARLDELGDSYNAVLIAEAKQAYDDVITVAATLPDEKKAQLIAFVQELANV
jgi:hypothetical protein